MNLRAVVLLCGLGRLALAQTQACTPLEADRILAKDLTGVLPAFSQLPAETFLTSTPPAGSQRIFHPAELLSLAQRYGMRLTVESDVCFERAMQPLDRHRVLEAMHAALQIPDAQIELSETSLYPVPRGTIEFKMTRLGTPASPDQRAPVLWRGDVIYGEDHRFAIWARVRIMARHNEIVAAENLSPGRRIDRSQLREVVKESFPTVRPLPAIDQLAGMTPLRPIAAGTVIRPELLSQPNDINRGDLIEIEVHSGAARLVVTARAESGGRDGETISFRNLESNKIFPAQVTGKGKAIILTDALKAE